MTQTIATITSRRITRHSFCAITICFCAALVEPAAGAPAITPGELVAPQLEISGGTLKFTVKPSVLGRSYQLQQSDSMESDTWQGKGGVMTGTGNNLMMTAPYQASIKSGFFRLALDGGFLEPTGFELIPAGDFQMGDQSTAKVGFADELPVRTVKMSAFRMGKYEVTTELWESVRSWGTTRGYTDLPTGIGAAGLKGIYHPVHSISWYAAVKWCNARSEKDGLVPCYTIATIICRSGANVPECNWAANGYRLPSEAEWEKAARGGAISKNFPLGDTITHAQANYYSSAAAGYDVSTTRGYHPTYQVGSEPYSSSIGSFQPNGYGLYDMAGNMFEWNWDRYGAYATDIAQDPTGGTTGAYRVFRGGSWGALGSQCRVAFRYGNLPNNPNNGIGFRVARSVDSEE